MWPSEQNDNNNKNGFDDLKDLEVIKVDIGRSPGSRSSVNSLGSLGGEGFFKEKAYSTQTAYVTWAIIAVEVVAFLLQCLFGVNEVAEAGGANWPTVVGGFQIWRLVTCFFLHSNFEHLIGNMIVLGVCGVILERRIARGRVLKIFLFGGLFASIISVIFNHALPMKVTVQVYFWEYTTEIVDPLSIGASGAIAALLSATLLYLLVLSKPMDGYTESTSTRSGYGVLVVAYILYNATGGIFTKQNFVDTAAHIGGFVAGMVIILIFLMIDSREPNWD